MAACHTSLTTTTSRGSQIGVAWLAAGPTLAEDLPTTSIRPGEDRLQITRLPTPGDFVYLAGVIVGRLPGEGNDTEAFKAQLRRAFATIDRNLKASGASMADVVDMQTLAVFGAPDFNGDMTAELNAYAQVKVEFMRPPYRTETLVGVKQLVEPGGLMEIRVIAYAPKRRSGRR
jgi:enamine deaminase RidA (YjgF/YER057c/UK114 family)